MELFTYLHSLEKAVLQGGKQAPLFLITGESDEAFNFNQPTRPTPHAIIRNQNSRRTAILRCARARLIFACTGAERRDFETHDAARGLVSGSALSRINYIPNEGNNGFINMKAEPPGALGAQRAAL